MRYLLSDSCLGDRLEALNEYNPDLCPLLETVFREGWSCKDLQGGGSNISGQFEAKLRNVLARYISTNPSATSKLVYFIPFSYASENMAIINVYVRDPYVRRYVTEEKITEISFVGTVGGLLGLFVGFSFISVVEVLYYLARALLDGVSNAQVRPEESKRPRDTRQ